MQERKMQLNNYLDENQAMNELGVNEAFFKWLLYTKHLKVYVLNEENSDMPGIRIYAKTDVESMKKSFCYIVSQEKTCNFVCDKRNQ